MDHTPLPWTLGYGEGITGPTTPSVTGVTCEEYLDHKAWNEGKHEYPSNYHFPISRNGQTIAIIPTLPSMGKEGMDNARFIWKACNSFYKTKAALEECQRWFQDHHALLGNPEILHRIERVIRELNKED